MTTWFELSMAKAALSGDEHAKAFFDGFFGPDRLDLYRGPDGFDLSRLPPAIRRKFELEILKRTAKEVGDAFEERRKKEEEEAQQREAKALDEGNDLYNRFSNIEMHGGESLGRGRDLELVKKTLGNKESDHE